MLAWPLGIALVIGLYFSENIWGHYRFKVMCAKEGGLKVYQPLVKGAGWKTEKGSRNWPLSYFFAGFTRYSNEDGQLMDVRLVSGQKTNYFAKDFSESSADFSKQPIYEFRESYEKLANETRLSEPVRNFVCEA
jgi:hypothetical protein